MWESIDWSRCFHDEGNRSQLLKALCNQICNNEDIKQNMGQRSCDARGFEATCGH
jgi:hypothetical protein